MQRGAPGVEIPRNASVGMPQVPAAIPKHWRACGADRIVIRWYGEDRMR